MSGVEGLVLSTWACEQYHYYMFLLLYHHCHWILTVTVSSLSLLNSWPLKQLVASSVCLVTATLPLIFLRCKSVFGSFYPCIVGLKPTLVVAQHPNSGQFQPTFQLVGHGWPDVFPGSFGVLAPVVGGSV